MLAWSALPVLAGSRVAGAAICRYAGANGCYLFYCDAAWSVIEDFDEVNPTEAAESLERRYPGAAQRLCWRVPGSPGGQ
ncbi:MAG: hypothetical protein K0Q72_106 [Armatimonadetes bacterium]|nr:hypothetical protein [Armatimonadota bacterium]